MRSLVVVAILFATAAVAHSEASHRRRDRRAAMKSKQASTTRRYHLGRLAIHGPLGGQSYGLPWDGALRDSTQLPDGDGYVIRRPLRSFATKSTVDFVQHAIADIREQFPDAHVLAIGDMSGKAGGPITGHRSHQSGRDVDVGLIYKVVPDAFPREFAPATEENLDCEATYALISEFANTARQGGAQIMFLDFNVQRMLYGWALDHGEDVAELERIFQYPRAEAKTALVQHAPNHDDHLHVRFHCPKNEPGCNE